MASGVQILDEHKSVSDKISNAFNLKIKETKPVYGHLVKKMSEQNKSELELQEETFNERQAKKAQQLLSKGMSLKSLKTFTPKENNFAQTLVLRLKNINEDVLDVIDRMNKNKSLLKDDGLEIIYAEPNRIYYTSMLPNDPFFNQQWAHKMTQAEAAWDIETGDSSIVIAIIDSGVDTEHEDLKENIHSSGGYDFVDIDTASYGSSCTFWVPGEDYDTPDDNPSDFLGHGTAIAGISSAKGNNNLGVCGVAPNCSILPLRAGYAVQGIIGIGGAMDMDAVINAIDYAVDHAADIINMSFGSTGSSQSLKEQLDYAYGQGIVLVAAAGNEKNSIKQYPAAYVNVIAVTSTDASDLKAFSSSYGEWTDLAAPGEYVLSTVPIPSRLGLNQNTTGYQKVGGTSCASPYISGVAGLILAKNPLWSPKEVTDILIQSLVMPKEQEYYIGVGRVNVLNAIAADTIVKNQCTTIANISNLVRLKLYNDDIYIHGTASGATYTLSYGSGIYPREWITFGSGISTYYSQLGVLDISDILDGLYSIRLRTQDTCGHMDHIIPIRIGNFSNMMRNWPIVINTAYPNPNPGVEYASSLTVSDLDGNGTTEVIVITGTHKTSSPRIEESLYIYTYDGKLMDGWPRSLPFHGFSFWIHPSFADLDDDGLKEIIVAGNSFEERKGFVHVYNIDGTPREGWPREVVSPNSRAEICIADINADNDLEIIFASSGGVFDYQSISTIYAFTAGGTNLTGWPVKLDSGHRTTSNPILLNIDDDSEYEVIYGANHGLIAYLAAIDNDGSFYKEFHYTTDQPSSLFRNISAGDINKDGRYEIISELGTISNNGDLLWTKGYAQSGISIGNLNLDSNLEIVSGQKPKIIEQNGNIYKNLTDAEGGINYSSAIIADIIGDNYSEIIVPYRDASNYGKPGLYVYSSDGQIYESFPRFKGIYELAEIAVADLDGDGDIELIGLSKKENIIIALDFNKSYHPDSVEWAMHLHDERHTGLYFKSNTLGFCNLADTKIYKNDTLKLRVCVDNPNNYLFNLSANTDNEFCNITMQDDSLIFIPSNDWTGIATVDVEIVSPKVTTTSSFNITVKKLIEDISDFTILNGYDTTIVISTYRPDTSSFEIQIKSNNDSVSFTLDLDTLRINTIADWYGSAEICIIASCDNMIDSSRFKVSFNEPPQTNLIDNILDITVCNGVDTTIILKTYRHEYVEYFIHSDCNTDSLNLNIIQDTLIIESIFGWYGSADILLTAECGNKIDSVSFNVTFNKPPPINLIDDIEELVVFNGIDTTISLSIYSHNDSTVNLVAYCDNDSLTFHFSSESLTITALYEWHGTANVCLMATCGKLQDSTNFQITIPEPVHTGINDLFVDLSDEISVYPNPNHGIFNLNYSSLKEGDLLIEIYDLQGKKVFNKEILSSQKISEEIVIDLKGQQKGIYMLKVLTNTHKIGYSKIIIE